MVAQMNDGQSSGPACDGCKQRNQRIAALEAEVRQLKMEREGITQEDIEDTMPPPRTIER